MNGEERFEKERFDTTDTVADAWRKELEEKGYEPQTLTRWSCIRFAILSRTWRRILRCTDGLSRFAPIRALEVGCGGGAQLVPLYVNGWSCAGVDVSPEVLARARMYAQNADKHCHAAGTIEFRCLNFLNLEPDPLGFDVTFHFGVLEHYLDAAERRRHLEKMFDVTRPGGFVVSVVPNGGHVFRAEQRESGLGGYIIPEIDYSVGLLRAEMIDCGAISVQVLPHDLFGYLKLRNQYGLRKVYYGCLYYLMQLPVFQLLPMWFLENHAYSLIAIARKPEY
jgi:SAM-dependent methyltransferase